ncbi:hypothetical protein SARC_15121, partial [Sphaeroforma arctica JP610]
MPGRTMSEASVEGKHRGNVRYPSNDSPGGSSVGVNSVGMDGVGRHGASALRSELELGRGTPRSPKSLQDTRYAEEVGSGDGGMATDSQTEPDRDEASESGHVIDPRKEDA